MTVTAFLNIEDGYTSKFKTNNKRDIYLNDATGIITLTVWGDENIAMISKSGTYALTNLNVRLVNEEAILSTIPNTKIVKSTGIQIEKIVPSNPLHTRHKFPVRDLVISAQLIKCPKCNGDSQTTPASNFFKCSSCNAVTRGSNVQVHRVIKVTIDDIEVTIFQPQIQEYCQKNNIQNDEDVITEAFLSDERSTMVVGRNNVAVGFEE